MKSTALVVTKPTKGLVTKQPKGIFARMSDLLAQTIMSESDAVQVIAEGISAKGYRRFAKKLRIPPSLVAPESTVRRRLASNTRFSGSESERVLRLARVYAEAVELFGDDERALTWMNTPANYLSGAGEVTPMEVCATDPGARLIEAHLLRTAHGIF